MRLEKVGTNAYTILAGVSVVRLVSGTATYAHDPRFLGAAIAAIRVDGQPVSVGDPALSQGFHDVERNGAGTWRWEVRPTFRFRNLVTAKCLRSRWSISTDDLKRQPAFEQLRTPYGGNLHCTPPSRWPRRSAG